MDLDDFRNSVSGEAPPEGVSEALQGLWHLKKGDWDRAHEIVQDEESGDAAWVHAHLHRVEGDEGNAGYWYRRAGRPSFIGTVEAEWDQIAGVLLKP